MDEEITKTEILVLIRSERESLEVMLEPLSDEQMIQPGVENTWSIKDILAHITDWERRMVQWIKGQDEPTGRIIEKAILNTFNLKEPK